MLHNAFHLQVKPEVPAMDKSGITKPKDEKAEPKDLRSNPPTKVKLPFIPVTPPVKDKPVPKISPKPNGETVSPKQVEDKKQDQFDGVDVQTEKLSHPTANRAKPPQRRPPTSSPAAGAQECEDDNKEAESTPKKSQPTECSLSKPELAPKTPPPVRPAPPKVLLDGKTMSGKDKPTVESLQAEVQELRMALELLQTRQKHDIQEVKDELHEERNKRMALQEEVLALRMKK